MDHYEDKDKRKMHHELHNLAGKYEEVVRRMGRSSSVEQLFNNIDFPYTMGCDATFVV